MTTGEIAAHLAEVYGTEVSRETMSKITDAVIDDMTAWLARPLEQVYVAVCITRSSSRLGDGQVANRPVYAAIGVTVDGTRDILGLWMGDGGQCAKFWLQVLTEINNRGTTDVCIVVRDGRKGLPDAIEATWPLAIVQTCVLHLHRQHLPARLTQGLGRHGPRPAAGLHRGQRAGRQRAPRRVPCAVA